MCMPLRARACAMLAFVGAGCTIKPLQNIEVALRYAFGRLPLRLFCVVVHKVHAASFIKSLLPALRQCIVRNQLLSRIEPRRPLCVHIDKEHPSAFGSRFPPPVSQVFSTPHFFLCFFDASVCVLMFHPLTPSLTPSLLHSHTLTHSLTHPQLLLCVVLCCLVERVGGKGARFEGQGQMMTICNNFSRFSVSVTTTGDDDGRREERASE